MCNQDFLNKPPWQTMADSAGKIEANEEPTYDDAFEMQPVNVRNANEQYEDLNIPRVIDLKRDVKRGLKQLKVALAVVVAVLGVVFLAVMTVYIFLGIRHGTGTNGGWSVWADWTDCSATCNTGLQSRQRQCNNPEPSNGGQYCQGNQIDVVLCNKQQCSQTNGGWSVWEDWTDCSATCNAGVQSRQRQRNNPEPSSGGQYCLGRPVDIVQCNKQQCPPKNGGWSVWAHWTDCSATCNAGVQSRQRQCNRPEPSNGGQYCPGSPVDVVQCNIQQCSQRKVAFSARIFNQTDSIYLPEEKIIFDQVYYNEGSGYNSSSGIFTAPKTGTYVFTVNIEATNAGEGHVSVMVLGYPKCEALAAKDYDNTGGCTAVAYVKSGEQVWVKAASHSQQYVNKYRSNLNGFLID